MNFFKLSKENTTIAFYAIYLVAAGLLFELFPGDSKTPNMGVLALYVFIPISLIYFISHLIKQLYSGGHHAKCLLIHGVVWISIITILTIIKK